jgi:hypothetical protein
MGTNQDVTIDVDSDSLVTEDDASSKHKKEIYQFIFSQDTSYAIIAYNKKDNLILLWSEENKQQEFDMHFKLDQDYNIVNIVSFKLYEKILLFHYKDNDNELNYCK